MNVKDLTPEQLNELKQHYFYSDNYDEKITTAGGLPVLFAGDIPNNIIYKIYSGICFVNDDFTCTAGEV